jgi:hypothetical protein
MMKVFEEGGDVGWNGSRFELRGCFDERQGQVDEIKERVNEIEGRTD